MPSNHCSNWEYHDWLKNKNRSTIEAGMFWCEFNNGENYFIGPLNALNNPNYKMFRKQELDYYKLQKIADKKGVRQIDISYIPKKK